MKKRILVLGASGFIGGYLVKHLSSAGHVITGTYYERPQNGLVKMDLLDATSLKLFLTTTQPELVIFLSGTKDVARCEKEPGYAVDLNVQAVRNYLLACTSAKLRPATLFFSTDYVFDGAKGYYKYTDTIGPKTVYGATNMLAERLIQSSGLPALILRVSAVMGRRGGFYHWLEDSLQTNTTVELFDNTFFSPTSIGRLCSFVAKVAEHNMNDAVTLTHLSDGYRLTRFEFGQLLAEKLGKPLSLIKPKTVALEGIGFQSDLSLLPDGMTDFLNHKTWDELGKIF
jgi:dTDP-4-dehydrorhamnose reductase